MGEARVRVKTFEYPSLNLSRKGREDYVKGGRGADEFTLLSDYYSSTWAIDIKGVTE